MAISRRTAIIGGVAFIGAAGVLLKSTELPKLDSSEKQDLINRVVEGAEGKTPGGMEFFMPDGTSAYYSLPEMQTYQDEIIKNIKDNTFRAGRDFNDATLDDKQSLNTTPAKHQRVQLATNQSTRPTATSRRGFFTSFAPKQS